MSDPSDVISAMKKCKINKSPCNRAIKGPNAEKREAIIELLRCCFQQMNKNIVPMLAGGQAGGAPKKKLNVNCDSLVPWCIFNNIYKITASTKVPIGIVATIRPVRGLCANNFDKKISLNIPRNQINTVNRLLKQCPKHLKKTTH